MSIKLAALDGSNSQEIISGQLEIRRFPGYIEVVWNDRGVRNAVLTDPAGVTVTVVP